MVHEIDGNTKKLLVDFWQLFLSDPVSSVPIQCETGSRGREGELIPKGKKNWDPRSMGHSDNKYGALTHHGSE